nr:hypothetical protein [uncultured Flavobacterium sp.]
MTEYQLSSKEVYQVLSKKGIDYLHHSNTVATSITFIENKALLSRHYIETNNLHQTPQKSDGEDKDYDVWDHIFLDGEDLHKRYSAANKYGPILFKLKLDMLTSPMIPYLYVTKSNPWYWKKTTTLDQKFYKSCEDIEKDYLTGKRLDSQIMFTIRNPDNNVKLNKFLHSIEIDKPKLVINLKSGAKMSVGDYAFTAIQGSLNQNGLGHIPITIRHSNDKLYCKCTVEYNILQIADYTEFKKRFAK